jgi:hypothetical protein
MKKSGRYLFIFFFFLVISELYGQPGTKVEEFKRKRHFLGNTPGHPYTTFDRHNGIPFEKTINAIRKRIKDEIDSNGNLGPVAKAYQQVYNHADTTMPLDNGMPETGVSELALWAKNHAFVMLIGLKGNGETLTLVERLFHRQKVLDAFDHMTGEIPDYAGKYTSFYASLLVGDPRLKATLFTPLLLQEKYKNENFKFYARSHILWVQAYDLLKASAALPELETIKYYNNFDSDANILVHSPRNKLRSQTRNLYKASKGMFGIVTHRYGWKQNHGIACAAALLISAQVLNDAGVETDFFNKWYSFIPIIGQIARLILEPMPHPNYSPINWHEFAKEGLYENLFVGEQWWPCDNNPTSLNKSESCNYSPCC